MLDKKKVGEHITDLRDQARMTQPEVAEKLGISLRQYQRWESGTSLPYWKSLEQLAEIFDQPVESILYDSAGTAPTALAEVNRKLDEILGLLKG